MKKIIFAILIFSISIAPLMFPYSKNKIPEVNMSITSKYEDSDIIL